ncbi:hypothetical protein PMIN06_000887 [Paraphaeosphaeria minitans]|uniref:Uncharacterized protein n=1 Tax=Paraphaeosphaeria minitans TaxID=565426 RepID=A0A9P6KSF9_9PLEO|nr:hypothetical protein PMIN01_05006 [Paraphaeosphaeria minitans]
MVYYPVSKYIKKSDLRQAADFAFSDDAKRADHTAVLATCMRCAQNLVKLGWGLVGGEEQNPQLDISCPCPSSFDTEHGKAQRSTSQTT